MRMQEFNVSVSAYAGVVTDDVKDCTAKTTFQSPRMREL